MFYLKKVVLNNFRCYDVYKCEFINGINIIVGNNAVGKTSLVEAIYTLISCKSHKTSKDVELVKRKGDYFFIKGLFNNEIETEISLSYSSEGKKVAKDNKVFKNLSEYIGTYKVVMFCPEDLKLVKGDPSIKRRFLDQSICQIDDKYLRSLMRFKKILKQRNELLKKDEGKTPDMKLLEVYTEELIKEGSNIIEKRAEFIDKLNPYLSNACNIISNNKEKAKIIYKPSVFGEVKELINVDMLAQTTTKGPHRDDFCVMFNNEEADIYASQGQLRTMCLSIKLGLAKMYEDINDKIIVILDDVFGELDYNRQNDLLKLLNFNNQIFITTTSISNLSLNIIENSKIIEIVKAGD